ncbi:MAG TPA: hypothetical protein DCP03_05045 [Polaromonas sp.]|nr:hypothetical protein [Polaromonas sp.]
MRAPEVEGSKQERTAIHTISSRAFVPPWSRIECGRQLSDQTAQFNMEPGTLAVLQVKRCAVSTMPLLHLD